MSKHQGKQQHERQQASDPSHPAHPTNASAEGAELVTRIASDEVTTVQPNDAHDAAQVAANAALQAQDAANRAAESAKQTLADAGDVQKMRDEIKQAAADVATAAQTVKDQVLALTDHIELAIKAREMQGKPFTANDAKADAPMFELQTNAATAAIDHGPFDAHASTFGR